MHWRNGMNGERTLIAAISMVDPMDYVLLATLS
jgi:hypothetical protein